MMRRRLRLLLAVGVGLVLGGALVAFAAGNRARAASLPFAVRAVTGAAQRGEAGSYFDVVVAPGHRTDLAVVLQNRTAARVEVAVAFHTAATGANGQIDYSGHSRPDKTLTVAAADCLTGARTVTLPPRGRVTYRAGLTLPRQPLAGLIAGALTFTPKAGDKQAGPGLGIVNRYRYSIAVVARNRAATFAPRLAVGTATLDARGGLSVPLVNVAPTFLNQLEVSATAVNLATGRHTRSHASQLQMAPNSRFGYRLALAGAAPGRYRVTTTAHYVKDPAGPYADAAGTRYRYRATRTQVVTLSAATVAAQARRVRRARGGVPGLVIAAVALVGVLLVVIAALAWLLVARRREAARD
ncbi:WxL protein peptidoglycan domain-containing protein [Lacticaseibacillus kribbianus]|uniref:WxL protein peptidoglycan domain-containing protein n=1 Tax=Lacticaseibacillus kribbianus TaxID=2926292 RepID=UPI001CD32E25|nr:DUF916 domain-containing protein [Lacticaseibacillus kribbianus]